MLVFDVRDLLYQVSQRTTGELQDTLQDISKQYNSLLKSRTAQFSEAHRRAAHDAQIATVRSYRSTLNANRVSGYRSGASGVWRRYSGGVLEEALTDRQMVRVDAESVYFVNTDFLDRRAKQWYRLNFGTVGAGGRPARATPITFMGVSTGLIAQFNARPSAPFRIPAGFFIGASGKPVFPSRSRTGQDEFVPYGYYRTGRGRVDDHMRRRIFRKAVGRVAARRFLDDGLAVLAQKFPEYHHEVLQRIGEEAVRTNRRVITGSRSTDFIKVKTFRTLYGDPRKGLPGLL